MKTWTTRNGKKLKIKDMETSHIKNCIKYLEENPICFGCIDGDGQPWFDIDEVETERYISSFLKELNKRS